MISHLATLIFICKLYSIKKKEYCKIISIREMKQGLSNNLVIASFQGALTIVTAAGL